MSIWPSELEFDLDKALEHVPIHMEDPPVPPPHEPVEAGLERPGSVCFIDLPETESPKLQHMTKLRPRRKKTNTKPRKAAVRVAEPVHIHTHTHAHSLTHTFCLLLCFWSFIVMQCSYSGFHVFRALLQPTWSRRIWLGKWMRAWTISLLKKSQRLAPSET